MLIYSTWRSQQCVHYYLILSNTVIIFNLGFLFSKHKGDTSVMTSISLWLTRTHRVTLTGPSNQGLTVAIPRKVQGLWGSFVAWAAGSLATLSSPGPNLPCQTSHLLIHPSEASERGSKRKGLCRRQPEHFQVWEPTLRSEFNFI